MYWCCWFHMFTTSLGYLRDSLQVHDLTGCEHWSITMVLVDCSFGYLWFPWSTPKHSILIPRSLRLFVQVHGESWKLCQVVILLFQGFKLIPHCCLIGDDFTIQMHSNLILEEQLHRLWSMVFGKIHSNRIHLLGFCLKLEVDIIVVKLVLIFVELTWLDFHILMISFTCLTYLHSFCLIGYHLHCVTSHGGFSYVHLLKMKPHLHQVLQ